MKLMNPTILTMTKKMRKKTKTRLTMTIQAPTQMMEKMVRMEKTAPMERMEKTERTEALNNLIITC